MARERSNKRIEKDIKIILNSNFCLTDLDVNTLYESLHDDHDGTMEGFLRLIMGVDGDLWIETDSPSGDFLRFRNSFGGGKSFRVQNALKILALAIKLDNNEK